MTQAASLFALAVGAALALVGDIPHALTAWAIALPLIVLAMLEDRP
jgi:hypothetical protein